MAHKRNRKDWAAYIPAVVAACNWRLMRALTMVAVAALGAFVAYKTGKYELDGARLERELAQENLLATTERQSLLSLTEANAELSRRASTYKTLGQAYLNEADQMGPKRPDAAVLTLQAQEEFAAARALEPFLEVSGRPLRADPSSVEASIERNIARSLAGKGIETDLHDTWGRLDTKIQKAHSSVRTLAGSVVILILSLVMFTFSDLSRRPAYSRLWFIIGILNAFGAMGFLLISIRELSMPLLTFSALLVVLSVIAWKVRRRRATRSQGAHNLEPGALEPRPAFRAETLHGRDASSPFARGIVVLIAFTVLLSALAGYLYSRAIIESATAAHEALGKEMEMHSRSTGRQNRVVKTLQELAQVQEERARYAVARQSAAYLKSRGQVDAVALAKAHAVALDKTVADQTLVEPVKLLDDPIAGTEHDARFPQKLVNQLPFDRPSENHRASLALWDAFYQQSLAWNHAAGVFLATLTMFAVALYLFGQGYSMGRGPAAWALLVSGSVLVGVAAISAAFTQYATVGSMHAVTSDARCRFDDPAESRQTVADATCLYARAHVWLSDPRSADDYRHAVDDLSRVVKLRPDSVLAGLEYVRAVEREFLFPPEQSYLRLPDSRALPEMIERMEPVLEDLKETRDVEPPILLSSLGRYKLLRSFKDKDRAGVQTSLKVLQRAKESSEDAGSLTHSDYARILLNLALAQYASGNEDAAKASFHEMMLKHVNEALKTGNEARNVGRARNKRLIARTITDLEILRTYCKDVRSDNECARLEGDINEMKEQLIAATWYQSGVPAKDSASVPSPTATIEQAEIDVSPDAVRWQGQLRNFTARDRLDVVWYQFDNEWQVWRALPEVSGNVDVAEAMRSPASWTEQSYLKETNLERCVGAEDAARFRAEFYRNGKLVNDVQKTIASLGKFQAVRMNDLNVALCTPSEWTSVALPRSDGMLVRALKTPRGQPAVFVFTLYAARSASRDKEGDAAEAVGHAQRFLAKNKWTANDAKPLVLNKQTRTQTCATAATDSRPVYRSWSTKEGVRHIGIALPGVAPRDQLCTALISMRNRYTYLDK
jgi:hypothetical protein